MKSLAEKNRHSAGRPDGNGYGRHRQRGQQRFSFWARALREPSAAKAEKRSSASAMLSGVSLSAMRPLPRAEKLKARFVIHAASMQLGGENELRTRLRHSAAHSLRIANERGLKTIAFPAVGTGIAGFPLKDCAEIMLREAAQAI